MSIAKENTSAALLKVVLPSKISGAANRAAGFSVKYAMDPESDTVTMRSRPAIHAWPEASMRMFD